MNNLEKYNTGKWNPFAEMDDLQRGLSSIFDRAFGRIPMRSDRQDEGITVSTWAPLVDICENESEYLIKVELPEVKKEDLSVKVENGVLAITGERKLEREEQGKRYHRVERAYGSFSRSFTIPDDANPTKVSAEFKDGMLKVHLGKEEAAKPRTIDVKVS